MWAVLNGTIVNSFAVLIGSVVGASLSARVPQRYQQIVLQSLGLITITLGIDAAVIKFGEAVSRFQPQVQNPETYGARLALVMISSLVIGSLIGTALRLHERIESMGTAIHRRFARSEGEGKFAEGFLTATVIFCVGPLTLLGCLRNGVYGDPSYLYIKSLLDGFCSIALASSLGWGVLASVVAVFGLQGALAYVAYATAGRLDEVSLLLMTVVGGVVLLATAFMILDIKKIPVANLCPGILLPPVIIFIAEWAYPGLLLPIH